MVLTAGSVIDGRRWQKDEGLGYFSMKGVH